MGLLKPPIFKKISDIEASLGEITNNRAFKIQGVYSFERDFGGVANDSNVDNSQALITAISTISATGKGGKLLFGTGAFYFSTPIVFSSQVKGVILEGICNRIDTAGTQFIYTGTVDWFMKFNAGFTHGSEIRKLAIKCMGKYGLYFNNGLYKAGIDDVTIYGAIRGLLINKSGYGFINKLSINSVYSEIGSTVEYFVKIGEDTTQGTEFLYFDKCTFEGGDTMTTVSDMIIINSCGNVYFRHCDFCNVVGRHIYLHTTSSSSGINHVYFSECNFTRGTGGICSYAELFGINDIHFFNCRHNFYCKLADEKGFYITNANNNKTSIYVNNHYIRNANTDIYPDYFFQAVGNSLNDFSVFELTYTSIITVGYGKIDTGSDTCYARVFDCRLCKSRRATYTGDGSKIAWDIVISNQSPFRGRPYVTVNTSLTTGYSINVVNVNGGALTLTVTFATPPGNGATFIIFYDIIGDNANGGAVW